MDTTRLHGQMHNWTCRGACPVLTEAAKHSENFSTTRGEEGLLTILPAYQVTRLTEKAVSAALQLLRLYAHGLLPNAKRDPQSL